MEPVRKRSKKDTYHAVAASPEMIIHSNDKTIRKRDYQI